jgi:hypothetical protein
MIEAGSTMHFSVSICWDVFLLSVIAVLAVAPRWQLIGEVLLCWHLPDISLRLNKENASPAIPVDCIAKSALWSW